MENLNFIEELNALVANEDVLSVSRDVNDLRSKLEDYILEEERKIQVAQLVAEEKSEAVDASNESKQEEIVQLKEQFYEVYNAYKEKRKALVEEKKSSEAKNLGEKLALIKRLKEVISTEENIGSAFSALNEIQDKWKEVGDIPRDKRNEIQGEYSRLLEDFFYNINIYKELKNHDFHRNFQLKTALIAELKKINQLESIREVETELKKLQNDWEDIGPVPNEEWENVKEAYWTEIRSIYNKVNRFYDDRRVEQQGNLAAKAELVAATRALIADKDKIDSSKGWEDMSKEILEIQAKWKTIGFGPKKENEQIWKEFRAVCDEFFAAKKEFFASIHEEYDGLAKKKKGLIEKALELKDSTEWQDTANKLKQLQQQWKQIGHAGVKHEQKLWKEFRGACDAFFNNRQAHFDAKDAQFEGNLKLKEELIAEITAYKIAGEKKQALSDLKEFANKFNAIGMVPMKSKDGVFKAFKTALDKHYGDLKMEGAEKEAILFEAKIDALKASPSSNRSFSDLKADLRKEIDAHNKEIIQLENNLGFFANSKGADALKKDVERKVDAAKAKIIEIRAKLKMIPNE